ncbi:Na/Pi symporter [bacterium]|nr:Na/Pi symporter [bacterium]
MKSDTTQPGIARKMLAAALFMLFLYLFLLSIQTMGLGFSHLGKGFSEGLIRSTTNPVLGLFIGLLSTAIVQSSSSTTSIVVGLVASGALTLHNAIPIIMGANIGTTVTNLIVSLGHISHREDFRRAYASSVIHDMFNMLSVLIFLPLQYYFQYLERVALFLSSLFDSSGGMQFASPLKMVLDPVSRGAADLMGGHGIVILVVSLAALFLSLTYMVKNMKLLIMSRAEVVFEKAIFRTKYHGFLFGMLFTALVQSSSVTTSLVVPLAGAGMLSIDRIFPYTLGANIGTTITAMLAAVATGSPAAVSVALAHLMFNVSGTLVFWWMPFVPIRLAEWIAMFAARNRIIAIVYILVVFFLVPLGMIWLME